MKKIRSVICLMLICSLILFIICFQDIYPLKTEDLISEKYSGWSGVLRIWIYEGWQSGTGSMSGWLNLCSSTFEKSHEGVYIQIQYVDESAIREVCENGVIPPDMIIYPPGLIETPRYLVPLESESVLRTELINAGAYDGVIYAQPIAMGGYIWAYNTDMLDGIPNSWKDTSYSISSPENEEYHAWDAALMGLCSGRFYSEESNDIIGLDIPGIDLGLSFIETTPIPTATAVPVSSERLYCQLPDVFMFSKTAYSDFIEEKIAAIPVTQREITRLEQRSSQGKGPDWRLSASGEISFSDQILYISIIDHNSNIEKQSLCKFFIQSLLSEKCQNQLCTSKAFSVSKWESGYSSYDVLTDMEYMLRNNTLYAVPAFSKYDNLYFKSIVRNFIESNGFIEDIFSELLACIH